MAPIATPAADRAGETGGAAPEQNVVSGAGRKADPVRRGRLDVGVGRRLRGGVRIDAGGAVRERAHVDHVRKPGPGHVEEVGPGEEVGPHLDLRGPVGLGGGAGGQRAPSQLEGDGSEARRRGRLDRDQVGVGDGRAPAGAVEEDAGALAERPGRDYVDVASPPRAIRTASSVSFRPTVTVPT